MFDIKITFVEISVSMVVVLALLYGGYLYYHAGPSTVIVSGIISNTGNGTHLTAIEFINSSGSEITTNISASGQYTIPLDNHQTYTDLIYWKGVYPYQNGTVKETYDLSSRQSNVTNNFVVQTPNAFIFLSGKATTGISTSPLNITFEGLDDWLKTVTITNNNYSVTLPNIAYYYVSITHTQSTLAGIQPPTATCNASIGTFGGPAPFNLNVSAGITNLTHSFSC